MHLISVNREASGHGSATPTTGIRKAPSEGPVVISQFGVTDDFIADRKHHGGPDQAVYLYSAEDYDWWSETLGRPCPPGLFGENLLLSSFGHEPLQVGDRFEIGECLFEVTAPRIPCGTLAARMEDTGFVKRFAEAGRPGAYARVLREGHVAAGDPVRRLSAYGATFPLLRLFRMWYEKAHDREELLEALAAPVAVRTRAWLSGLLDKTGS